MSLAQQAAIFSSLLTNVPVVRLGPADTRHDVWPEYPYQDLDGVLLASPGVRISVAPSDILS